MKKGLLSIIAMTTLFVLIASSSAFAQLTWDVGVKGGLSIADLIGDDADSTGVTDMRMGFVGGAFITAHINDDFAVRVEGLYVMKGAKGEEGEYTTKVKLDYFEIPVLAVIKLPATEKMTVNGFAGPTIAFSVSAKVTNEGPDVPAEFEEMDIKDEIKSIDYGLTIGAGFEYDLGTAKVLFDGRWVYGLASIDDTDDEWDIKNSNFELMAGVAIPIGK